jgi:hypothetical protein
MKKIIFERYKLINIILFLVMLIAFTIMNANYNKWFQNADISYVYRVFDAIYHPIMVATKWLACILGMLLLLPSHIFKKWLFFVLPIPLIATYWLVQNISVNSGGILHITRAQMAESGMIVLAVATGLFVAGHLLYDFKKRK